MVRKKAFSIGKIQYNGWSRKIQRANQGETAMHALRFWYLAAVVVIISIGHAFAVEPGKAAPRFELSAMDGVYMESSSLFESHDLTFLVFWESQCRHCVESLERADFFYREYGGGDITVVGINTDSGGMFNVRSVIESAGVTFLQLLDQGGGTADRYDVPFASLALYVVDSRGLVVAGRIDPEGDMYASMVEMLEAPRPEPAVTLREPAAAGRGGGPGLTFRGDGRIRFLGIDTRGSDPVGPYGEEVTSGNHVQYRFMLEMSKRLGRHLTFGALLRISNEGEEVLDSGPDYFGSEWGSAFASIEYGSFRVRIGYYTTHMTPLTLMRWDWRDNPRIGGDAGCGCGAAAAVLLIESLERLGPDLTFEGAQAVYAGSFYELTAFYAMPRRARKTRYTEYRYTGESARYALELYGAEARLQRLDGWTGRHQRIGLHFLGTRENDRSVDFVALGYPVSPPWDESMTLSLSCELPLLSFASLEGEWLLLNRGDEHSELSGAAKEYRGGNGSGTAGLTVEYRNLIELSCDYVRTDPEFYSPFAALSYEENKEGVRTAATLYPAGETVALSLFYKRARDTENPAFDVEHSFLDPRREQFSFFGASIDLELEGGLGGSMGYLDLGRWREGDYKPFDETRKTFIASCRYRLVSNAYAEIRYERIEAESNESGALLDSQTNLYSFYLTAAF
jgi:peroxiredoxin